MLLTGDGSANIQIGKLEKDGFWSANHYPMFPCFLQEMAVQIFKSENLKKTDTPDKMPSGYCEWLGELGFFELQGGSMLCGRTFPLLPTRVISL